MMNVINGMPAMGNETVLGKTYSAFMKKEMTEQEWHIFTAHWASEHLEQYRPKIYSVLDSTLRDYLSRRSFNPNNPETFNPEHYVRLAKRTMVAFREIDYNSETKADLLWCLEKIQAVQLGTAREKLEKALAAFENINPPTWFNQATAVMAADAEIARRLAPKRGYES